MATFLELITLENDATLRNKTRQAMIIAAELIMTDATPPTNQAARLIWAGKVFANPKDLELDRMYRAVIAANKDAVLATIQGASDSSIQANVDAHIDLFADLDTP